MVYLHHQKCLWLVKSVSSLFADMNFSGTTTLSLFRHLLFNIFQQFKGWQGMANELQGMEGAIPCQSPK